LENVRESTRNAAKGWDTSIAIQRKGNQETRLNNDYDAIMKKRIARQWYNGMVCTINKTNSQKHFPGSHLGLSLETTIKAS